MKKKGLVLILFFITIFFVACSDKKVSNVASVEPTVKNGSSQEHIVVSGPEIKSIYRTKDEWIDRYVTTNFEENHELTEPDAKKIINENPELAVKCKTGTFIGKKDDDVLIWKGIPYAKKPSRKLRFMRSEVPDASDKYFEAYNFGKTAIQPRDIGEKASLYKQGEDCLNLNIWTSTNIDGRSPEYKDKKKPVFVYIHGGGWGWGGTSDPLYDGWNFAHYNPDMIIVTITYRVGFLGQINLSKVDNSYTTSMANSVLDQVTALKWLYENIEAFGGDPYNINVAGESAGGGSVSLLCTLPEARKYMKKAMPMSGGANQATLIENTYTLQDAFIKEFNIKNRSDIEALTEEQLMNWWEEEGDGLLHHCVQDGVNIPNDPVSIWEKGDTKDLLVLQGHTANEFAYYLPQFMNDQEVFDKFCETAVENLLSDGEEETKKLWEEYKNALLNMGYKESDVAHEYMNDKSLAFINTYQASMHARNGGKGYSYTFEKSYDGPIWGKIGAAHAIDCYYLFGNFDGFSSYGTNDEVELSKKYQKMLTNFCLSGNPSIEGYEWPEYNEVTRYKMMFGDNLRVEENPEKTRVEVEMKMVEKTDFFKPTTIAKIMEQLFVKYPDLMIGFILKNVEKKKNTEVYQKADEIVGNIYDIIIKVIGNLSIEQDNKLFENIENYVNIVDTEFNRKLRKSLNYFRKNGTLPKK